MSQPSVPAIATESPVNEGPKEGRRKSKPPVAIDGRIGKTRAKAGALSRQGGEPDHSADEVQFMKAMDQYKRDNRRAFPTWSETLEVIVAMGYRKVAEPTQMPGLSTTMSPEVTA